MEELPYFKQLDKLEFIEQVTLPSAIRMHNDYCCTMHEFGEAQCASNRNLRYICIK